MTERYGFTAIFMSFSLLALIENFSASQLTQFGQSFALCRCRQPSMRIPHVTNGYPTVYESYRRRLRYLDARQHCKSSPRMARLPHYLVTENLASRVL